MYIDYLTEMNESHVKVAEFNTAPLMEPGFDYEEYYHEVSFLLESFKNLLQNENSSVEQLNVGKY